MTDKSPSDVISALARLKDDAIEAQRYVRTDIAGTRERVRLINDGLASCERMDRNSDRSMLNAVDNRDMARWRCNLYVGREYVQVDPAVLENALYNAAFEIGVLVGRLEKQGGDSTP